MKATSWLKMASPVLAALVGLAALRLLGPDIVNQEMLSAWVAPFGQLAPALYVALMAVRPLTLLPGQVLTAVGGMLFGTAWATAYSLAGSFLANALSFFLARRFGKGLMRRLARHHYGALERIARRHDFRILVLATVNPLLPTDLAIAAAAASGSRFWPTVGGSLLGTLPGTLLTAQFGSALSQGKTLLALASALALLLSLGLGVLLGRRVARELSAEPASGGKRASAQI